MRGKKWATTVSTSLSRSKELSYSGSQEELLLNRRIKTFLTIIKEVAENTGRDVNSFRFGGRTMQNFSVTSASNYTNY